VPLHGIETPYEIGQFLLAEWDNWRKSVPFVSSESGDINYQVYSAIGAVIDSQIKRGAGKRNAAKGAVIPLAIAGCDELRVAD
jgi:hypothetical protein